MMTKEEQYLPSRGPKEGICEWCDEEHGGVWCPVAEQLRRRVMLKTTILYTLPSSQDVFVYCAAEDADSISLEGLELAFFSMDGDPLDVQYSREVFEEVADLAHQAIYEDREGAESEEGAQELSTVGKKGTGGAGEGSPDPG